MSKKQILIAVLAGTGIWVLFGQDAFVRLQFRDLSAETVFEVLTPLFLAALFIERAVEVYAGVSREPEKQRLMKEVETLTGVAKKAADAQTATFKRETAQKAFILSFLLGLATASVGIRCLWPLLDPTVLVPDALQFRVFNLADVVITAGLLAGGSAGIHIMISPINDWLLSKRR